MHGFTPIYLRLTILVTFFLLVGCRPLDPLPEISILESIPVLPAQSVPLEIEVNYDGDVSYQWQVESEDGGIILNGATDSIAYWRAPTESGFYTVKVVVTRDGHVDEKKVVLEVVSSPFATVAPSTLDNEPENSSLSNNATAPVNHANTPTPFPDTSVEEVMQVTSVEEAAESTEVIETATVTLPAFQDAQPTNTTAVRPTAAAIVSSPTLTAAATSKPATETPAPPTETAAPPIKTPSSTPTIAVPTATLPAQSPTPAPPSPTPAPTEIRPQAGSGVIINLQDGNDVALQNTLIGQYMPTASHPYVWLVVKPVLGDTYYPQSSCDFVGTVQINGYWEIVAFLGGLEDVGTWFDIIVIAVDESANQLLKIEIERWCEQGDAPGLNQLPNHVELEKITVIRNERRFGYRPWLINEAEIQGEMQITSVKPFEDNPRVRLISGTLGNPDAAVPWLLLYTPDGRYHPQSNNPCGDHIAETPHQWQGKVSMGGDSAGLPFRVVSVLANENADRFFQEYFETYAEVVDGFCVGDHYPGLLTIELPAGIDEKDSVEVIWLE